MNFLFTIKTMGLIIAMVSFLQALLVLIRRKPIVLNSSYHFFTLIPILLISYFCTGDSNFIISNIVILFLLISFIFIISRLFRGVTIFGSSDAELQNKLAEYLSDRGVEFEQIPTTIYINKKKVTLSISFNEKYGTSGISMKGKVADLTVNNIVKELRQKELKFSYMYPIYAAVSGSVLLISYFILTNISH